MKHFSKISCFPLPKKDADDENYSENYDDDGEVNQEDEAQIYAANYVICEDLGEEESIHGAEEQEFVKTSKDSDLNEEFMKYSDIDEGVKNGHDLLPDHRMDEHFRNLYSHNRRLGSERLDARHRESSHVNILRRRNTSAETNLGKDIIDFEEYTDPEEVDYQLLIKENTDQVFNRYPDDNLGQSKLVNVIKVNRRNLRDTKIISNPICNGNFHDGRKPQPRWIYSPTDSSSMNVHTKLRNTYYNKMNRLHNPVTQLLSPFTNSKKSITPSGANNVGRLLPQIKNRPRQVEKHRFGWSSGSLYDETQPEPEYFTGSCLGDGDVQSSDMKRPLAGGDSFILDRRGQHTPVSPRNGFAYPKTRETNVVNEHLLNVR